MMKPQQQLVKPGPPVHFICNGDQGVRPPSSQTVDYQQTDHHHAAHTYQVQQLYKQQGGTRTAVGHMEEYKLQSRPWAPLGHLEGASTSRTGPYRNRQICHADKEAGQQESLLPPSNLSITFFPFGGFGSLYAAYLSWPIKGKELLIVQARAIAHRTHTQRETWEPGSLSRPFVHPYSKLSPSNTSSLHWT